MFIWQQPILAHFTCFKNLDNLLRIESNSHLYIYIRTIHVDMRDANHSWMCIVHIFYFFCNNLKFAQLIQFGPVNTTIVKDTILLSNVFNSGIWVLAWLNIIYTKSMGFHLLLKIFHFHLQLHFDENMKMDLTSESTIVEFTANNITL